MRDKVMSTTIEEFKFKHGSIRKFDPQDLKYLLFDLIDEDREYAEEYGFEGGYIQMVREAAIYSVAAFSLFDSDGDFVCSFGVRPTEKEGVGDVWFLSSNGFNKNKNDFAVAAEFLKHSRVVIDYFNSLFPVLTCLVQTDNKDANRRTKFMGFSPREHGESFTEYMYNG